MCFKCVVRWLDGCGYKFGNGVIEESLGFMEIRCWVVFGGGDFRESVVESRLFFDVLVEEGKGERVW